jgi:hypothetical protein
MRILGIFLSRELRTCGHTRCLELMGQLGHRRHHLQHPELLFPPRDSKAVANALRCGVSETGSYILLGTPCVERLRDLHFGWTEALERVAEKAVRK